MNNKIKTNFSLMFVEISYFLQFFIDGTNQFIKKNMNDCFYFFSYFKILIKFKKFSLKLIKMKI